MYSPEWMDIDMTKRRSFSVQFKATVARKTLRGDKTVQEISVKRHLHPTQVSTWKRQAMEGMASLFSNKADQAEIMRDEIKELHARTGQLAVANEFLSQGLKRWACPLPGSRYAVSMRGGTPPDNP